MKRLKTYKLFESKEEINDIVSLVKEMLLELDFLDIDRRVDIVNNHSKLQVGQSPDIIVINLWKKAIKIEGDYHYKPSYIWDDIKSVIEPVMGYLESEGFEWYKDRGTLAYPDASSLFPTKVKLNVPIISTSGSAQFDTVKSKVEMWFIR
jgi:hypothetical protein